jgi:hypothetical protein
VTVDGHPLAKPEKDASLPSFDELLPWRLVEHFVRLNCGPGDGGVSAVGVNLSGARGAPVEDPVEDVLERVAVKRQLFSMYGCVSSFISDALTTHHHATGVAGKFATSSCSVQSSDCCRKSLRATSNFRSDGVCFVGPEQCRKREKN